MDRKYSVAEIDRMREAIASLPDGSRLDVEARLRTYMLGGVEPSDLDAENARRWAEQPEYEQAVEHMRRQNNGPAKRYQLSSALFRSE